jgi:hypothetical protein
MWAVARFYAYLLTASSIRNFGNGSMPIYDKGQTSNILATSRTTAMARWDRHSRAIPGNWKYPFCQFCFCIPLFLQNVSKCGVIIVSSCWINSLCCFPSAFLNKSSRSMSIRRQHLHDTISRPRADNVETTWPRQGASRSIIKEQSQSANRHRRTAEKLCKAIRFG